MYEGVKITGFADEISPGLEKQIAVLSGLGMEYMELRTIGGRGIGTYGLEEAKQMKRRLDAAGIRVSSIGSPIGKIGIEDDFETHLEQFRYVLDLADLMEAPYIRIFSFYIPEGGRAADHRSRVLERLERLSEAAAGRAVLLHENEKGIYGDTADKCAELLRACGGRIKAVFDFANFVECGQDPLEAYEKLLPYIAYIHIKDVAASSGRMVPAGSGDGRIPEILSLLQKNRYEGFLSLEPHLTDFAGFGSLERDRTSLEGQMTGEAAFKTAWEALMRLLKQL